MGRGGRAGAGCLGLGWCAGGFSEAVSWLDQHPGESGRRLGRDENPSRGPAKISSVGQKEVSTEIIRGKTGELGEGVVKFWFFTARVSIRGTRKEEPG